MSSDFHDVGHFHNRFGLPAVNYQGAYPRHPTRELLEFRLNFLLEELTEIVKASGARFEPEWDPIEHTVIGMKVVLPGDNKWDHAEVFDGLLDLAYVTFGMAHILGYPWRVGWNAVQDANMTKERATETTASLRGGTWDVVKPEGWTAPDIAKILRDYGWEISE